jgi:hypothetical protein
MPAIGTSSARPPVELQVIAPRKIVHLHFRDHVKAADIRGGVDELHGVLKELGAGFTLVTDLSELEEMDIESVADITRMMDISLALGVKQVIRVIPNPDKDIGFRLLSLTHYRGRVKIYTCQTWAEAARLLPAEA